MKTRLVVLFFIAQLNISFAQTLTVNETVNYINELYRQSENGLYILTLSPNGKLTLYQDYSKWNYTMNVAEVKIGNIYTGSYGPTFDLICKNYGEQCIMLNSSQSQNRQQIQNRDLYLLKKFNNSFKYLFAKIEEDGTYTRQDDDPFAPNNYNSHSVEIKGNTSSSDVKLDKANGIYYLNVTIGSISQKFILDSGASEILISEDFEKELIKQGIVTKVDYLTPALYRIADGSIVQCRRVILPSVTIGGFTVKNVNASVGNGQTPLLLGKSFFDKFKSWKIDNISQTLKLEK
ncbi:MAG: retroviral-like aspartic protease family protein [Flavobacterium sp.]|nr:retroviral-like aspartic protease family protein [Flavobacterium sp.]